MTTPAKKPKQLTLTDVWMAALYEHVRIDRRNRNVEILSRRGKIERIEGVLAEGISFEDADAEIFDAANK